MKVIAIRTDSWHYRLLDKFNFYGRWEDDLCAYVRAVIGAISLIAICAGLALGLLACFGDMLAWAAFCAWNLTLVEPSAWSGGAFGVLMAAAILYGGIRWESMPEERKDNIAAVWNAVSGKLCVRIKRVDAQGKEAAW